jgi:uncharacterized membrane protein YgcG
VSSTDQREGSGTRKKVIRVLVVCVVLALAIGAVGWVVALVTKNTKDSITGMDIAVLVAGDGSLKVTQTFDVRYGTAKHGPYLTFANLQATDTAGRYRELTYVVDSVTSPTGAPATFTTTSDTDGTAIQVGSASTTVTGTQTYVVAYRVIGVMNPRVASSGSDELFWNVIGTGWELPMDNVVVTVTSDATVAATACWRGNSYTTPCTGHASSGGTATYTQSSLDVGEGLAIVAGWPSGTFTGAEPTYFTQPVPPPPFELTPLKGALSGGGLVVVVLVGLGLWRRSRDRLYVGLTPGNLPVAGEPPPRTQKVSRVPYAVRFTPPDGVSPGTVGTLIDKSADLRDVTAILVDLAVRGLVRIEQSTGGDGIQVARRDAATEDLAPYEATLLKGLFTKKRGVADPDDLQGSRFGKAVSKTRQQLYGAVVEAGWFVHSPEHDGSTMVAGAIALGITAIFSTAIAATLGWGLVMIPVLLLCVLLAVASRWSRGRTAVGGAALSQTLGFKQYLETAEADQIRWEEGEDIFSRYLPYAIAFGCADHWAGAFAELVDKGAAVPMPSWYVADGLRSFDFFGSAGISSVVASFDMLETSFSTGIAAGSVGSRGGTGFLGGGFNGGGFSGGGVGGGGGGTW